MVVDPVGGDRFTDSLRSLAAGGRLLVIGFTGGDIPTVKVNRLLLNNVDAVGVGWGAWAMTHPGYLGEQWAELEPLLASGAVTLPRRSSTRWSGPPMPSPRSRTAPPGQGRRQGALSRALRFLKAHSTRTCQLSQLHRRLDAADAHAVARRNHLARKRSDQSDPS